MSSFGTVFVLLGAVLCMNLETGESTASQDGVQYMACSPIDKTLAIQDSSAISSTRRRMQGPPGKRGPAGTNGINGIPGIVDYGKVNRTLEGAMQQLKMEMEEAAEIRMQKKDEEFAELEQRFIRLKSSTLEKRLKCDVTYASKCFAIVLSSLTVDQARKKCKDHGAELANIYSREHYQLIMAAIRKLITYHTQIYIGMTYNRETEQALLRDGTQAPYVNWHMLFPKPTPTGIPMGLAVDEDSALVEGMANFTPPHSAGGAVCEMAIDSD